MMTATSGAEAMGQLRAVAPRLIVTELELPDIDGLELLRIVRATPATERIPVAIFTAVNGSETEHRVRTAGAIAYIKKPIDVAQFAAQLEPLVGAA